MSNLSTRAVTFAAGLAIILLVILLAILWTGVRNGSVTNPVKYRHNDSKTNFHYGHDQLDDSSGRTTDGARIVRPTTLEAPSTTTESNWKEKIVTTANVGKFHEADDITDRVKSTSELRDQILPTSKGGLEYIRLMKISQNQYEDPLEEYETAKRHHSGHFRHAAAKVWDPHPQYEFFAFGRKFRLLLALDISFVSPDIKVTHVSENSARREQPGHQLGCFYSGSVDGDPDSSVTVSLCHGMTGHIKTFNGSYIIKPAENWRNDQDSVGSTLQHVIYYESATRSSTNSVDVPDDPDGVRNCGLIDYDTEESPPAPLIDDSSADKVYVGEHPRARRSVTKKTFLDDSIEEYEDQDLYRQFLGKNELRFNNPERSRNYGSIYSDNRGRGNWYQRYTTTETDPDPLASWRSRRALAQEYFIEILLVADFKMAQYHGEELFRYIMVLMNTVSRIYKDKSIGNPISIAVTNIIHTNKTFGNRSDGIDGIAAAQMLSEFCLWQKNNNPHERSPEHHDVALLLTRENLCHNAKQQRCDTLGLAELGKMCSPRASCAIVQDNGLAAAFTIAHEIGHVLNMPHDDDNKCISLRDRSGVHNVMSRMLDANTFPWEWSQCSSYYVTEFLESGYANCLLDKPSKGMSSPEGVRLPGEDYSENRQCELVFGPGSKICPYMVSDVCKRLWCTAPIWDDNQQCHTQHMPWADGTACAQGKWCQRGECVSRRNLKPVHGQWGAWGYYGECSRSCGGGIKKKYRKCNNPIPQHSGNYCIGEHVKYRSCGTTECPAGTPDFREQQCSRFNNDSLNIQNLTRNVEWHAKYTRIPAKERCKLYCQVGSNQYYMLRDKVIDGTPCGVNTFDICVNGHCKPAGCDHVLDSTAELDICGVCRGDNSTCQRITGSYNSSAYGYTRVTKIPAGSSYVDIRQYSRPNSRNDSNYLALRIGEGGKYILNGKFMVEKRKIIVDPQITIEYSGPEVAVERLNISRPTTVDLILEVLSVGNIDPPQITYEYTVPKRMLNSYTWVLSNWSSCNRVCQGYMHRKAECRSTEHKDVMSDDYCRAEEKPQEETQLCNRHCKLEWQVISTSECSNHCGPGTRMVGSRCVQIFLSGSHVLRPIPIYACSHIQRPAERQPCVGPCDDAHWSYDEWGFCSVSCGGGVQTRSAKCVDAKEAQVPDEKCVSEKKILKRICGQDVCPKWGVGEWSPCSVNCGFGVRKRPYWCQVGNQVVSENYCSQFSIPAGLQEDCMGPCHEWHTGDWSPCSVSCGDGITRRIVTCKNADGTLSNECDASKKPLNVTSCTYKLCPSSIATTTPITYSSEPHSDSLQQDNEIDSGNKYIDRITFYSGYNWRTVAYSECSKPCDTGYMNGVVQCVSDETGHKVSDDYCDPKSRPSLTVQCNAHPCTIWNTGDWSQCDNQCGRGFQHRQVRCQSHRGETLPDKECPEKKKPPHAKRCMKSSCPNVTVPIKGVHRWRVSKWSPCSKTCGNGVKTRRVECTMRTESQSSGSELPVEDEHCLKRRLSKPKSQRPCLRVHCDYTWQEGTWSECSAECGDGMQSRTVTCHRVNQYGWIDPSPAEGCLSNERPSTEQTCKLRECNDKYHWIAGSWEHCSHPCGRRGRQIRKLFCRDNNGRNVNRRNCPLQFKPQRKRKCNQQRCGFLSCADVKKRFKSARDGEYNLFVGGKKMMIYCHNMISDRPLEYLTLPAGARENYAEIYDKKLLNPHMCPYNGQRNDSCACATDHERISGKTDFERVRLDVTKLYIIADDYRFSSGTGVKPVEFGRAGDCYSSANCPQGRFGINLRGTSLRLAPEVTWVSHQGRTFLDINKVNDQQFLGKCGGYCGFCIPKPGLKLDVLPP
ncbi:A disintegrin and metalloproteinase with thrombospondin motifs 20 isoform X2 [Cephus cinctus]|uniref:A disintegrin and metalloproteinase with thrombospondin motifs 20 isoform X2 n=1 Tax=Cephus cinctus TaxID=211228 RepID=A0AAJ7CEW3_CEPCN|nr:A disintegrin and metalloproteinase with thrombospondin motifs 20 isoform X2 [Cephus cinctus]